MVRTTLYTVEARDASAVYRDMTSVASEVVDGAWALEAFFKLSNRLLNVMYVESTSYINIILLYMMKDLCKGLFFDLYFFNYQLVINI